MFRIFKRKEKVVKHKDENIVEKLDYNTKVLFDKSKKNPEFDKFKNCLLERGVSGWNTLRRYGDYNFYFKKILKIDIKDYISLRIKNKKKFSILEDGVGQGFLLMI